MKTAFNRIPSLGLISVVYLAGAFVFSFSAVAATQQQDSNSVAIQREAMQKLAFLAGRWSGPVTVVRGSGQPMHFTQSEDVQYKLGGLVLLIEGKSTTASSNAVFSALATVSFDTAARCYHIRAYNDGQYVDAKLSLLPQGFSWSFPAGRVRMVSTMHLTAKGEWKEVSEVVMAGAPPRPSVELLLRHVS